MTEQCTLIFLWAGKHNERAPAEKGNAHAPRNKVSHESLPLQLSSIIVTKRFDAFWENVMTKQCTLCFLRAGKHNERAAAEKGNAHAPRNKFSHESLPLQLTSIIVAKRFDALNNAGSQLA